MDDPRDYEVGYGKPPVHSRFKPGQSGNPKRRRTRKKEPASLLAEILKELNAVVTINENGEKMRVTKQQLLAKSQLKLAIQGKPAALKFLEKLTDGFDPKHFGGPLVPFRMTSEGQKLVELVEQDFREMEEERRIAEIERRGGQEPSSDW